MACLIELISVWKRFEDRDVIRGVDLCVEEGSMYLIRGRSGVGKSTLLRIAALLIQPDRGEVLYRASSFWRLPSWERERLRREVAYIPQSLLLIPHLTVYENIALPLYARGLKDQVAREAVSEVAERLGIGEHLNRLPGRLSGGERQRVAIARALVFKPQLVVADEPTAYLDEDTAKLVHEIFVDHCIRGASFVIATTEYEEQWRGPVREYWLSNGLLMDRALPNR